MTYVVLSDIHAHSFTLFAKTENGINTRLRIILDEMLRAAKTLQAAGGDRLVISGDILHTRGQIDPEVLNPLRKTIEKILEMGIDIYAIPGNHDLKSAETNELSSSIQNLSQIGISGGSFQVFNEPSIIGFGNHALAFVPWRNTKEQLMADLQAISDQYGGNMGMVDVFIHAGIDGVLSGMPAHGLTHIELGAFGFRRVFAGHYHNHKDFGNGVVSVGASTHHNWGDVGTKAGFLLVDEKTGAIEFKRSEAPHFIDVSGMTEEDMQFVIPGNYVRFRGPTMTNDEVKALRDAFSQMGALGTSIEVPRAASVTRGNAPAKAVSMEQSIETFVKSMTTSVDPEKLLKRSIEILHETQAVAS